MTLHTARLTRPGAAQTEGRLGNHFTPARNAIRQHDLLQGFSQDPLGFFDFLLEAQLQDIRCLLAAWQLCLAFCI